VGKLVIFVNISQGADVFVDANTLVYHFTPDPVFGPPCSDLLLRIKRKEIQGFVSTHVVNEMAHRMRTLEAIQKLGWPVVGIAQRLRKNPAQVQKLSAVRQAVQDVPLLGLTVLTVSAGLPDAAAAISQATGLLTNDALLIALMQQSTLTNLASHDVDFDRVPGITRYAPV
jgi:predicted nucleic acid-binding protein